MKKGIPNEQKFSIDRVTLGKVIVDIHFDKFRIEGVIFSFISGNESDARSDSGRSVKIDF